MKVLHGDEARQQLLNGAEKLYLAVKETMGPEGRNVIIGETLTVTHDGVTVAEAVKLTDPAEKVGAELIKQAAQKMNKEAGDGTTTVTVLTYHLLKEANRLIVAGHSPMALKRELEKAAENALVKLNTIREPKVNKNRLTQIATISAADPIIGELVAKVVDRIKDGQVTIEDGVGLELSSRIVEGFTFGKGYINPYMVTDEKKMEAVYEAPAIVVTNKKITAGADLQPMLELLLQNNKRELVLIAEEVAGEALGILVLNKLKGTFNTVVIPAPANDRNNFYDDVAAVTGATVVSVPNGIDFDTMDMSHVGSARKVVVTSVDTTIFEGSGSIEERIGVVKQQLKDAPLDFLKDQVNERLAALSGKVAVIKVGGKTETEIEEKKYRVEDAVNAAQAALLDGIVPGGGTTLRDIAPTDYVTLGEQLLYNAFNQPFRIILQNAGLNPDKYTDLAAGQGIDVRSEDHTPLDMKKAGVIDPARVTKEAIQNAVSIAGAGMTMGALIIQEDSEDTAAASQLPA